MTDLQSIRCPICLHDFDTKDRLPKVFTSCGHTICKECLTQVLKINKPQCPLDKVSFNKNFRTADAFPTNFLGKDLIEIENLWSKCPTHNEPNKMICLTDHTLVCANCVLFGDHKGHDVRLLSDLQDVAKIKKEQLEALFADISRNSAQLNTSLEEKQQNMKEIVKQGFQRLHAVIDQQQADMLQKLEKTFAEEKTRLEIMTSKSLQISLDVQNKLKEFANIRFNPNIAKVVEEDFSDLKKMADEEHMKALMKHTKDLSQIMVLFQQALPNETLLKDLYPIQPLTQKIAEYNDRRNTEQTEKLEDAISFSVELNIQTTILNSNLLKIESSPTKKNTYTFERSQLEKITAVSFKFKLNDDMHVSMILPAIMLLSKYLVNAKSIQIDVDSSSKLKNYEVAFGSLILACFSQPENFNSIRINTPNLIVKDAGILYLLQHVIPKIKDLEVFDCNFKFTQITNNILGALRKANFKAMPNLHKFKLNLSGTTLDESKITKFLLSIPNTKELELEFSNTGLTDKALDEFSVKVLPGLDKVETLEINLSETKITDKGVEHFMENLPNISHLQVSLNSLKITDQSLQSFFKNTLASLTNLKHLKIDIEKTNLTITMKQKIRDWNHKETEVQPKKPMLFEKLDVQVKDLSGSVKLLSKKLFSQPQPLFKPAASVIPTGLFSQPLSSSLSTKLQPSMLDFADPFPKQASNQTTPPKQRAFN